MTKISKKMRWAIGIGIFILMNLSTDLWYPLNSVVGSVMGLGFIVFIVLCVTNKPPEAIAEELRLKRIEELNIAESERVMRVRQAEAEKQRLAEESRQAEAQANAARHAEWERTHGVIDTKVSGVTFANEDGTERQMILKEAVSEESLGEVELIQYSYNGKPAIKVLYDGMCIGNVPQNRVDSIADVFFRITALSIYAERFIPEDGHDAIYRADLTVVYSK